MTSQRNQFSSMAFIFFLCILPPHKLHAESDGEARPYLQDCMETKHGNPENTDEVTKFFTNSIKIKYLFYSIMSSQLDCVERAIEIGGDVNEPLNGITPLAQTVMQADKEIVATLIAKGADPRLESKFGTPVDIALASGDMDIVRALISDPKELGAALILRGAEVGDENLVQQGLELGAPASAPFESAPLIRAITNGHLEIADLLLNNGARHDLGNGSYLAFAIMSGDLEMVKKLIEHGANPDTAGPGGVVPISIAVATGDVAMVDILLDAGAHPERKNSDGTRPAAIAAALGMDDLAARLGGAPELEPIDLPGLLRSGSRKEVVAAVRAGADPNMITADGWPVVLLAIKTGDPFIVNFLKRSGALFDKLGPGNINALHMVCSIEDETKRHSMLLHVLSEFPDEVVPLLSGRNSNGRSAIVSLINCGQFSDERQLNTVLQPEATIDQDDGDMPEPLRAAIFNAMTATEALDAALADAALDDNIDNADPISVNVPSSVWETKDADGITPALAALLNENDSLLVRLGDLDNRDAIFAAEGGSFADIARQMSRSHLILLFPNDRRIDFQARLGMSRDETAKMQQRLHDWGYYTGSVDGIMGAGTASALAAFLSARGAEIKSSLAFLAESTDYSTGLYSTPGFQFYEGPDHLQIQVSGDSCAVSINNWPDAAKNESRYAIACVDVASENFYANGFIYVQYTDAGEQIMLSGPEGWNSDNVKRFRL